MKRLLTRVGSAAAAAAAMLCPPVWAAAADTKQDVRVINTPTEAVPVAVQGTATVTGGVQVTNTPTVGLDPSQNGVKIANPATEPVPVVGRLLAVIPAGAFSAKAHFGNPNLLSGPDPAGTRYAVTSVTVENHDSVARPIEVGAGNPSSTDCSLLSSFDTNTSIEVTVPAGQTLHLAFPQPYVLTGFFNTSPGCLLVQGVDGDVTVLVVGYRF